MRRCSICDHADRAQIDQALIESVPLRTLIAKHTGTSVAALHRHRQHIPAALVQAKRAEEVADADSLLSQVKEWLATCKDLFAQAKEDKSWSGAASATREVSRCLEMLGKLSGELQSGKVTINLAAIQSLNISALSDEQLETLYIRLQEDERLQRENPRTMTDEEIEATLQRIALRAGFAGTRLREMPLFDEETVPPGLSGNQTGWRSYFGETKWSPYRNSSPSDRSRMLRAAWKRVTGCELPDKIREQDLGERAAIAIEFDLADPQEESWLTWPTVRLIAVSGPSDVPKSVSARPPHVIEGTSGVTA